MFLVDLLAIFLQNRLLMLGATLLLAAVTVKLILLMFVVSGFFSILSLIIAAVSVGYMALRMFSLMFQAWMIRSM